MKTYNQLLLEAGEAPGKLELVKTPLDVARAYGTKVMSKYKRNLDMEIPQFDEHYLYAQKQATTGRTQRKDMPVIDEKDVKDFQKRLSGGYIDRTAPFANDQDKVDPFPQGLAGGKAKSWLENGLEIHDGDKNDDKVKVKNGKVRVGNLHPIQQQIYFDKSMDATAQFGVKTTTDFLTKKSYFIVSSDNHIIDGHHRYLSGILIDPDMKVNALIIDLPISELLPLSLAYSDAVGNKRNA